VDLNLSRTNCCREDFLPKVAVVGFVEDIKKQLFVKNVQTHASQAISTFGIDTPGIDPTWRHANHIDLIVGLGFFQKAYDSTRIVATHDSKRRSFRSSYRNRSDGDIRIALDVGIEHLLVIHTIQLITAEDQNVLAVLIVKVDQVLANSIRGAFEPSGIAFHRLLSSKQLDKPAGKIIEAVRLADMLMKRNAQKLSYNINFIDTAVKAVAYRNVD
jgi:hypothetical protein